MMIDLDLALDNLDNVARVGHDRFTARCPAHDDHNSSLSVARGSTVTLLLKCFAGCDFRDILAAITAKGANRGR